MRYVTKISGGAKFWHPTAPANTIETAFGRVALNKYSVGESRKLGDTSEYKRTYCRFELISVEDNDANEMVEACLLALRPHKVEIEELIATGGELWLVVKIWDDPIQINLEHRLMRAVVEFGANLLFEFNDKNSNKEK